MVTAVLGHSTSGPQGPPEVWKFGGREAVTLPRWCQISGPIENPGSYTLDPVPNPDAQGQVEVALDPRTKSPCWKPKKDGAGLLRNNHSTKGEEGVVWFWVSGTQSWHVGCRREWCWVPRTNLTCRQALCYSTGPQSQKVF